jgi:hypothetical protein
MPTVLKNYVICFQLKLAVQQQAIKGHSTDMQRGAGGKANIFRDDSLSHCEKNFTIICVLILNGYIDRVFLPMPPIVPYGLRGLPSP